MHGVARADPTGTALCHKSRPILPLDDCSRLLAPQLQCPRPHRRIDYKARGVGEDRIDGMDSDRRRHPGSAKSETECSYMVATTPAALSRSTMRKSVAEP
jgi:hypothetical protein